MVNNRHKIFGASSEKTGSLEEKPEIMDVFNEAEASADPSVKEPDAETMVGGYIRKKKGKSKTPRKELLKNLPIEKIICRNPEEDHICELCESEMIPFSEKFIREEIQIIPAKIKRIHYYQEILLCPACKKEHDEFVTAAAETPSPLMLHSPASPSTVAYIMYQKYANAMPLYRREKDWLQMGVKLHRATMANWINKCTLDYLKPVYDRLHEYLILREILHADEVPCQVLHEDGKTAASKSYMWIYLTGDDGEPGITLYEYQPGRSGDYPKQFLRGFHGFLHCDAYQGYNKLEEAVWRKRLLMPETRERTWKDTCRMDAANYRIRQPNAKRNPMSSEERIFSFMIR